MADSGVVGSALKWFGSYLAFNSHHPSTAKRSVVSSLAARAMNVTSNADDVSTELAHICSDLEANGYPKQFVEREIQRTQKRRSTRGNPPQPAPPQPKPESTVCIPFVDGTSQAIRRILAGLNIRTVTSTDSWKWTLQRGMKDQLPIANRTGAVYQIKCSDCDGSYIGETKRSVGTRMKEHLACIRNGHPQLSAAAEHALYNGHRLDPEPAILDTSRGLGARRVKEALWIHNKNPSMNRDRGLELSPLWLSLANFPSP